MEGNDVLGWDTSLDRSRVPTLAVWSANPILRILKQNNLVQIVQSLEQRHLFTEAKSATSIKDYTKIAEDKHFVLSLVIPTS